MEDFSDKLHTGWGQWVVDATANVQLKNAAFIGCVTRPLDPGLPFQQIIGMNMQYNIGIFSALSQYLQFFPEALGSSERMRDHAGCWLVATIKKKQGQVASRVQQ
jgi:hypothetical protein